MAPLTRIAIAARVAARDIEIDAGRRLAAGDGKSLYVPPIEEIGDVARECALAVLRIMRVLPRVEAAARARAAVALVALAELLRAVPAAPPAVAEAPAAPPPYYADPER